MIYSLHFFSSEIKKQKVNINVPKRSRKAEIIKLVEKNANLEFIKTYLEQRCIRYFITSEDNNTRIRWNKSIELPFRYSTIYNETKEKYIRAIYLILGLIIGVATTISILWYVGILNLSSPQVITFVTEMVCVHSNISIIICAVCFDILFDDTK